MESSVGYYVSLPLGEGVCTRCKKRVEKRKKIALEAPDDRLATLVQDDKTDHEVCEDCVDQLIKDAGVGKIKSYTLCRKGEPTPQGSNPLYN